ncbi:GldL-related protein [Nonlabens marinus]|uniref:GldL-related protein n=1 Tax=Nonlabens marinus TaxID=930802 RepID=UPI0011DD0382|nr:hypothetical protein [Nonlabens marinus]
MKNKTIIIILAVGVFLIIVGALFKILHWGFGEGAWVNGNTILATGLTLKVVALVSFITKFLNGYKK